MMVVTVMAVTVMAVTTVAMLAMAIMAMIMSMVSVIGPTMGVVAMGGMAVTIACVIL